MKSQIKIKKEQKHQFVELLIPIINLLAINSYLFYWKGQTMNNHHKIISLHVVLPPLKYEGISFFFLKKKKKKSFKAIQKKAS